MQDGPNDKGKEEANDVEVAQAVAPAIVAAQTEILDPIEQLMRGDVQIRDDAKGIARNLEENDFKALARSIYYLRTPEQIFSKLAELSSREMDDKQKYTFIHNARKLIKELIAADPQQVIYKDLNSYLLASNQEQKAFENKPLVADFITILNIQSNKDQVNAAKQRFLDQVTQSAREVKSFEKLNVPAILTEPDAPPLNIDLYFENELGSRSVSFRTLDKTAQVFSRDLKQMNLAMLTQIQTTEFHHLSWTDMLKQKDSPNIVKMTRRFNEISNMARDDILLAANPQQQKNIYNFYLKTAKAALDSGDYLTAKALNGTFLGSSIYRLEHLSQGTEQRRILAELKELDANNSLILRDAAKPSDKVIVPFIGYRLTDLNAFEELPEVRKNNGFNTYNFDKSIKIGSIIYENQQNQHNAAMSLMEHAAPFQTNLLTRINTVQLTLDFADNRSKQVRTRPQEGENAVIYGDTVKMSYEVIRDNKTEIKAQTEREILKANNYVLIADKQRRDATDPKSLIINYSKNYNELRDLVVACQKMLKERDNDPNLRDLISRAETAMSSLRDLASIVNNKQFNPATGEKYVAQVTPPPQSVSTAPVQPMAAAVAPMQPVAEAIAPVPPVAAPAQVTLPQQSVSTPSIEVIVPKESLFSVKIQRGKLQQALNQAFPRLPQEDKLKQALLAGNPLIPAKPRNASSAPMVKFIRGEPKGHFEFIFKKLPNIEAVQKALETMGLVEKVDSVELAKQVPKTFTIIASDALAEAIKNPMFVSLLSDNIVQQKAKLNELKTQPQPIQVDSAYGAQRVRLPQKPPPAPPVAASPPVASAKGKYPAKQPPSVPPVEAAVPVVPAKGKYPAKQPPSAPSSGSTSSKGVRAVNPLILSPKVTSPAFSDLRSNWEEKAKNDKTPPKPNIKTGPK